MHLKCNQLVRISCPFLGINVTLSVSVEPIILEPDSNQITLLEVCFRAQINRTLLRDAVFELEMLSSTATLGVDFLPAMLLGNISIPAGFQGLFNECSIIYIIGDDEREENENIVYSFTALSEMDSVYIPPSVLYEEDAIRIVIYDNDGM